MTHRIAGIALFPVWCEAAFFLFFLSVSIVALAAVRGDKGKYRTVVFFFWGRGFMKVFGFMIFFIFCGWVNFETAWCCFPSRSWENLFAMKVGSKLHKLLELCYNWASYVEIMYNTIYHTYPLSWEDVLIGASRRPSTLAVYSGLREWCEFPRFCLCCWDWRFFVLARVSTPPSRPLSASQH